MGPTGASADNIGGNTIHTALGMSIGAKQNRTPPQRIQRLWASKTIMIFDEISMVDLQTMAKMNNRCKVARSLSPDSPELFGSLPIVVLTGGFYQIPPVKGLPLWRQPRDKKEDEVLGKEIWNRFTDVIILDEQLRQAEDITFRNILQRARRGRLTEDDIKLLNSKSISGKTSVELHSLTCIVYRNDKLASASAQPYIFDPIRSISAAAYLYLPWRTQSTTSCPKPCSGGKLLATR